MLTHRPRVPRPNEGGSVPTSELEDCLPGERHVTLERDTLATALDYAARGWHVIPLLPGSKRPAVPNHPAENCDGSDPICSGGHLGWEQRAERDTKELCATLAGSRFGIGIATGPSGLVVLDLDVPDDPAEPTGLENLLRLAGLAGEPAPTETFTVRTPSGGRHLYFRQPPDTDLHNSAGRLAPHIDTRAVGGYVVAPPTDIGANDIYRIERDLPVVVLPDWLVSALQPPQRPDVVARGTPGPTCASRIERYIGAALDGERERLAGVGPGKRNNTLFLSAISLGQLVAGHLLELDEALAVLHDGAAAHVGDGAYSDEQARKTIASGLERGFREPRTIPTRP